MKLSMYRWKATDRFDQQQRGELVAEDEIKAKQILFSRQLRNIRLQRNWQLSPAPKNVEICDLLQQLATLLQASVPLKNSLHILLSNCANIPLYQWLQQLLRDIESGLAFSQTLNRQQKFLTHQECQLIRVGEMTGQLAKVCQQIALSKQQGLALQRKIQKILLYPMMILIISLILTALLLIFIVPQFAEMYGGESTQLPLFTQILMNLSQTLQQYFVLFCLGLAAIIFFIKHRLRHSLRLHRQKNKLVAVIPVLGQIVSLSRLVRFCRSLHLMLHAGVPLHQALLSFLPTDKSDTVIRYDVALIQEVQFMLQGIQKGFAFSACVGSALFPMQAQQMLQVGERAGKLPLMLQHIADNYQQQLDHKIDLLSQMLEPFLMLIIGSIIGLIMLGMYLPIFNMGSLIQ
ncbi:type II secretion system protein F [Actinobacillus succinogenes]|uniref:Type II secretion system protein n=1 Tax=Actinobacillus succinogenes (strain ATCC 55618 / DSM 22257 / CCUG 43843 / 130Z) TaxID=339671 RepID=A6VLY8_ACTSZ|nr:type II secretion system F family protein [Actinobacillus succinogenes]ABR73985.1 type II secretion system protein [Actinobacillus succinogenes 130Z]PHI39574.1 type II secretion system protein F [Actinobacillus succinogenes]